MTLAEQLRALREAAGLSQSAMARAIALSTSQISRIETRQRDPSPETVAAWAEACGRRASYVFTPIADPAPESTIARPVTLADFTDAQLLAEIKRRMEKT